MSDLIKREDAINAICKVWCYTTYDMCPHDDGYCKGCDEIEAIDALPSAERNCFTCGMEDGTMKFIPENVSDEVIEANDRTVKLSDVCKFIKANFEMNPKQWGELRSLPSAEAYFTDGNKIAEWIPCSERLPSDSGNYLITVADLRLGHNGEHTVTIADFYAKAKKWNSIVDVVAWMPLPDPYREDGE